MASIQEKVEMAGLFNIHTQWLYLVTDSNENSEIIPEQIKKSKDGYNLAFLYNASAPDVSECRVSFFYSVTVISFYISQGCRKWWGAGGAYAPPPFWPRSLPVITRF